MSDDLVKRLRSPANVFYEYAADGGAFLREAADEIERLREALRYYAENHYPNVNDGPWGVNSTDFGDVARAALANKGEKP